MNALDSFLRQQKRGAAADLARRINVPAVLISQWRHSVQRVPEDKCLMIESATEGRVRCETFGRTFLGLLFEAKNELFCNSLGAFTRILGRF